MKINAFSRRQLWILLTLLVYLALAACAGLKAQPNNDDFDFVRAYKLPDNAVPHEDLVAVMPDKSGQGTAAASVRDAAQARDTEKILTYKGQPFSGVAFEHYDNHQLSRVQTYKNGVLDGPSYVWYPNGAPQMYVNYRAGLLNGRFLGWYMHGGVLYDMVINNQGYAGDFIGDDRSSDDRGTEEGEGDAPDKDND